jgi:hypothetical protein
VLEVEVKEEEGGLERIVHMVVDADLGLRS